MTIKVHVCKVKSFSGGNTVDMEDYVKPLKIYFDQVLS